MQLIKKGIPRRFIRATWSDFNFNGYIEELKPASFDQFIKGDSNRGYFFTGVPGSGKTMFISILAKQIFLSGKDIAYYDISDLKQEYLDTVMDRSRKKFLEWVICKEYLFINDMGSEKSGEGFEEFIFNVIDKREQKMNNRLVITSNYGLEEIATRVNDRIPSRISGMCGDARVFQNIDWRDRLDKYDPLKSEPVPLVLSPAEKHKDPTQEEIMECVDKMLKLGLGCIVGKWMSPWMHMLSAEQKEAIERSKNESTQRRGKTEAVEE